MNNLQFVEKHGKAHNQETHNFELIKLYPYQKEILSIFEKEKFIAFQSSRQMGLTTMICFHITNFLIHNTNKNNLICIKSNNSNCGIDLINNIRTILFYYDNKLKLIKNNQKSIKLFNGNEVRLINNIDSLDLPNKKMSLESQKDKDFPYALIIDNAAWVDKLDRLIEDFMPLKLEQIILTSGKNTETNFFYNNIFTGNNLFTKKSFIWSLNPRFDTEWYERMKKDFGTDTDAFNCEVDLVDPPTKITNKDRVINIRLDDETMNKISIRLIDLDVSLSDYIRSLINKDISNNYILE